MTTAMSCNPYVETEDEGIYRDEEGIQGEELGEGEIITDQEMVEEPVRDETVNNASKPIEDKGKAVDCA